MRLRNKKTGEIVEPLSSGPIDLYFYLNKYEENEVDRKTYQSLAELNSEWEDYAPKEPLIKDEKVRKAVRAWAEANNFFDEIEVHSLTAGTRFSIENYDIEFLGYFIYDLESNKTYTIAELCGEDEE